MDLGFWVRQFERFKRMARSKYPLEYLEQLVGRVSDDVIEIVRPVPVKHTAPILPDGLATCEANDVRSRRIRVTAFAAKSLRHLV